MNRRTNHHDDEDDDDDLHDRGLQFDVQTLMQRRHVMKLFAGAAAIALVGCSDSDGETPTSTNTTASGTTPSTSPTTAASVAATVATAMATATVVAAIPTTATTPASSCTGALPTETAGPFPGDGSNGPNVLSASGIVRSDIRSSFGTSTKQAEGVPLEVELTIVDTKNNCAPLAGAAMYLWHCDRAGLYSMYSPGATNENYCRGVQVADAAGKVKFTTIFPAAYSGRWPHIHFEVYASLDKATSSTNKIATSQLALPDDVCKTVFATAGYEASVRNHAQTTLQSDNVFRDGVTLQMATVTGSVAAGYKATLVCGVRAGSKH